MKRTLIYIAGILTLASVASWAQAGSTTPLSPTLAQNGEIHEITLGARISASYLSNVGGSGGGTDDERYNIDPEIGYQREDRRLGLYFDYQPGLTISQKQAPQRNLVSQSLDFNSTYLISPRWSMAVKEQFRVTSNPFFALNPNAPTFTPTQSQTGTVLTPLADRLTELASVDFTYQVSPKSYLGFGGNYSFLDFHRSVSSTTSNGNLIGNEKVFGRIFYGRTFGRHHTVGLEYDYANLQSFRGFTARTITHTGLLFDQIALGPNLRLALYAGPEYQDVHDQLALGLFGGVAFIPVERDGYSYSTGAAIDYTAKNTTLSGNYSHRAGDGGGLIGSVQLNQVTGTLEYRFTQRFKANVNGDWSRMTALSLLSTTAGNKVIGTGAGVTYQLRPDLSVDAQYGFTSQGRIGTLLPVLTDRHRVTVSLQYRFRHPLGR